MTFSYLRELEQMCFLIIPHWSLTCFFAGKKSPGPMEQRRGALLNCRVKGGLLWVTVASHH